MRFRPLAKSGGYAIRFRDESDLVGERLFTLRLRDDPKPSVQLNRPSKTRDLLSVLPTAELPLDVTASDPEYGLRSVFLEYRFGQTGAFSRLTLFDPLSKRRI